MKSRFNPRIAVILGIAWAAGAPAATPQDAPALQRPARVTFEESGDFFTVLSRLAGRFSTEIPIDEKLTPKDIRVAVRNGGYYEILDALCREHGSATYFLPEKLGYDFEDGTTIRAGPWVEHPSAYHGEFKVLLSHAMHTRQKSVSTSGEWTDVGLIVFAPPWDSLCGKTNHDWTIHEATDMDGKNLLLKRDNGIQSRVDVDGARSMFGNRTTWSHRMAAFDPARGLRSLSGKVRIETIDLAVARIPLKAGESTETSGIRIIFRSMTEGEGAGGIPLWKIKLGVEGGEGSGYRHGPFETLVRFEGDPAGWRYLLDEAADSGIAVKTPPLARPPAWLELRVRGKAKREIDIPFEFKNVVFSKEKP